MSADLERVRHNTSVHAAGSGGRALSVNVRRLHHSLTVLLTDLEREQFIHCLNVYHSKRNVFDLVRTLKVILDTSGKRQLMPLLRVVIPRADQLLFDQYTSEGLYLTPPTNGSEEGDAHSTLHKYVTPDLDPDCDPDLLGSAFMDGLLGDMRTVTLRRTRSHEGLGFSIRGGAEHGVGIYVSLVEAGSSAEREGLRVGDQIVTVNDFLFDGVTHVEAVKVLKGCKTLCLSVCSMGRIPGGYITNSVYSWVDPQGRSVSPPPDIQKADPRQGVDQRTVSLNMEDGRSLGLMIRGGAEYGLGIYVTGVDPGSAADSGALKVGDQIVEVNGQSFVTISHDEAVQLLKTGRHLLMKVKDVGRLPHARTVLDHTQWICSNTIAESNATANPGPASNPGPSCNPEINPTANTRPASARAATPPGKVVYRGVSSLGGHVGAGPPGGHVGADPPGGHVGADPPGGHVGAGPPGGHMGAGPPGAQVSLEQQAYMLLTEAQRHTMVYYLQQYQQGNIGVEALTMALFELFNTHAKLSMLSEVRALVSPQDVDQFDRLVLHREQETVQTWQGGRGVLQPIGHCLHTDTGHTTAAHETIRALVGSPTPHRSATPPPQNPSLRDKDLTRKPSTRMVQPGSSLHYSGPSRLLQDCLHRSLKSLPSSHQTSPCPSPLPGHHTSFSSLHYTCHSSDSDPYTHSYTAPHHFHSHSRPGSGPPPRPCPVSDPPTFLHHRDSSSSMKMDSSVKLASRSSSYEKSSVLSKSTSSSKAGSPMLSPHLSPHPSPCPSPSLITTAAPPCSPNRPCSPALNQKVLVIDANRLSADGPPQQRGSTLSQLSDSGQTLSEDSGVDIAEVGSPRPTKNQRGCAEQPGAPTAPLGKQNMCPVPAAVLVRVVKNANTLGIAIEGGANTRQPLPRIVTIQKGGSAHNCGQLKVGQVILEVNGVSLRGREHKDTARIIAEAFKTQDQNHIDFLVLELGL